MHAMQVLELSRAGRWDGRDLRGASTSLTQRPIRACRLTADVDPSVVAKSDSQRTLGSDNGSLVTPHGSAEGAWQTPVKPSRAAGLPTSPEGTEPSNSPATTVAVSGVRSPGSSPSAVASPTLSTGDHEATPEGASEEACGRDKRDRWSLRRRLFGQGKANATRTDSVEIRAEDVEVAAHKGSSTRREPAKAAAAALDAERAPCEARAEGPLVAWTFGSGARGAGANATFTQDDMRSAAAGKAPGVPKGAAKEVKKAGEAPKVLRMPK